MRLKADNRNLIKNQPFTVITAVGTAADTTITVKNSEGFADNDFVIIGKISEKGTEVMQVNGTPTITVITIDRSGAAGGLHMGHDEDTPVYKIDFDQVEFSHATTATGTKTVLTTKAIQPTNIFTYYEDTTYTTGYGFCRFKDSVASSYSVYSDPIPYTGYTKKMLRSIRKKVRRLINEVDELNSAVSNEEINDEINLAQTEIAHDRLWSFYEVIRSLSTEANKYKYSLASDVFVLYGAIFDTQPLAPVDMHRYNLLRWDSDTTGDPTHIAMWRKEAYVYPYPSSAADTTAIDDADDITATDTTITVDSTADFQSQGRIIIDSEVIGYTGTTSTTFTGCTRGLEGTTAATHADDATVTERDVVYHAQEDPDDLVDETDETRIPDPSVIAYKAGAEIAIGILEKEGMHDRLLVKFDRAMAQLRKVDEPKFKRQFGTVQNVESTVHDYGVLRNPQEFPQNINQ